MARGAPTARALTALCALEAAPQGRRACELADTLGVTSRTVHRILEMLQDAGVPLIVETEGKERRWRLARDRSPPVDLSPSEVLALLCAERTAGPGLRETVLGAPLETAIAKVRAFVPDDRGDRLLALARAHVAVPGPYHDYARRDVEIAALRRAIGKRVTARIRHSGQTREVDPYLLAQHGGALYLVGFCHRRDEVRTFLVDRIRAVTLTSRRFKRDAGFDADRYFDGAWGVYRGRPEIVRLLFAPEIARWASERRWPGQRGFVTHRDGSATLTLRVAPTPDLVAQILSHGARVRVLAPSHLAETVAREHFAAASGATRALAPGAREHRSEARSGEGSLAQRAHGAASARHGDGE